MKVITEAILRDELRRNQPECYIVPAGKILSPAGREYLQQRKIKIAHGKTSNDVMNEPKIEATEVPPMPPVNLSQPATVQPKFIDYETGAYYMEKPEHMTHLYGNVLVNKNHPRILFRGKLDSLQALIVLDQALLAESGGNEKLIGHFGEILGILREIMRCDVLDEVFKNELILGWNHAEIRDRSHHPMKYFNIQQMILPDYTMGKVYAIMNQLRTAIRETEVSAAEAFRIGNKYERKDIIEELNRLSSILHIMMCMYLAGEYNK